MGSEVRLPEFKSWLNISYYVTLSKSQFTHLENGYGNNAYLMGLLGRLHEMMHTE